MRMEFVSQRWSCRDGKAALVSVRIRSEREDKAQRSRAFAREEHKTGREIGTSERVWAHSSRCRESLGRAQSD